MKTIDSVLSEINKKVAELVEERVKAFIESLGQGNDREACLARSLVATGSELTTIKEERDIAVEAYENERLTNAGHRVVIIYMTTDNQMLNRLVEDQQSRIDEMTHRLDNQRSTIESYQKERDELLKAAEQEIETGDIAFNFNGGSIKMEEVEEILTLIQTESGIAGKKGLERLIRESKLFYEKT